MKRTAFTKFHEALGAKMVEFAGYYMPIQYDGLVSEHLTVRKSLGVFDVSHMGEFWILGPKALDFIQYISTNDASVLVDGKAQYSCMPNGKGGIVDDLLIYRINSERYLLVVNAANIEKDWNWCVKQAEKKGLKPGEDLINASDDIALLAVQGPMALTAMQKLTDASVVDMKFYTHKTIRFAGVEDVLFSTTGYTGSGGCEIYIKNEDAPQVWEAVMEAGREFGVKPAGLGARDTLRLEMGFALYGNDITEDTSPIEAGLGWITKFKEDKDFIDKEYLLQQKQEGPERRLKGFVMEDKGIPRQHYKIFDPAGNPIGEVTSGTMSPSLNKAIGMGYLARGFWKVDTEIYIQVRNKMLSAKVVKLPFYKG